MILDTDPTPGSGGMKLRLQAVLVRGPSMVPTIQDGDLVLAWRGAAVRPGHVVLARFRSRPDLLVIKRVMRAVGDGWWVEGDNEFVVDDSRSYGLADVEARVVLRYWPYLRRL
jgi:phage repressor protein C with HTH and peptisase S24 domain